MGEEKWKLKMKNRQWEGFECFAMLFNDSVSKWGCKEYGQIINQPLTSWKKKKKKKKQQMTEQIDEKWVISLTVPSFHFYPFL